MQNALIQSIILTETTELARAFTDYMVKKWFWIFDWKIGTIQTKSGTQIKTNDS